MLGARTRGTGMMLSYTLLNTFADDMYSHMCSRCFMLACALKHTHDLILGTTSCVLARCRVKSLQHHYTCNCSIEKCRFLGYSWTVAKCTWRLLLQVISVGNGVCIVDLVCDLL